MIEFIFHRNLKYMKRKKKPCLIMSLFRLYAIHYIILHCMENYMVSFEKGFFLILFHSICLFIITHYTLPIIEPSPRLTAHPIIRPGSLV